ncbi:glucose-6-phosphate isomerase [Sphingorhabdus soli]|uniref:Glucose-6-phosphate isomerase n=1 Tax=Flavisphingopyxis soli TaxID=2601267 RepID=A0A5C6U9J9_9SPHN|nr:glucose-6-phosphate isomerase [Sphingorhabdus soli]TXC69130.1 glucose-6-phosphate isomerase [Sphingorhabdus soli]
MPDIDGFWTAIEDYAVRPIADLVEGDADRQELLVVDQSAIRFDFTKTHLDTELVERFVALADAVDLDGARKRLFAGDIVNPSERRAAEHSAERGEGNADSVAIARQLHVRMRALIDAMEAGALGEIRHIIHIGIGGSALGPDLVIDALYRASDRYGVAVVSNVDGLALEDAIERFDARYTLVVVASKMFTTSETMRNAASALEWLRAEGVADPYGQFVALTADPEKALAWGIDETRILPFSRTVGGRYSLWSSIGFPIALALGWSEFEELLEGAAEIDRHFRLADWSLNACALAAFADLYYAQVGRHETRAVFAYDERLRLLPSYLQQLEMESNGKRVTSGGKPLDRPSAPIVWGGVGTDAQHAVFQLLHQGTHIIPVEFVASIAAGDGLAPEHHAMLLASCFAQGAALMTGRANADDRARDYPGDRPSTTILLDDVDARTLGALLAFYEHRTFVNATLLGINPFDQFGVELGKDMARRMDEGAGDIDPSTAALMKLAGLTP